MCLKIKWYFFYKVFKLNSVDDPHLFDPELGSASGIWILLGLIFLQISTLIQGVKKVWMPIQNTLGSCPKKKLTFLADMSLVC